MRKIISFLLVFVVILSLSGCEKNYTSSECTYNYGTNSIMETEYGYYFSQEYYRMDLHFYDKESGDTIILCNKPECEHLGDENCVATYKNLALINMVLYEGYIYVYANEYDGDKVYFNLYRVAPDASSIDKVGTVFEGSLEARNPDDRIMVRPNCVYDWYYFIIHDGYAYLPYYFKLGDRSIGFQGGGLKRMNLKNGNSEDISTLQYHNSAFPYKLRASGNKIYMYITSSSTGYGWREYDTETKEFGHTEWDRAIAEKNGIELKKQDSYFFPAAENDKYGFQLAYDTEFDSDGKYIEPAEDSLLNVYVYKKYSAETIDEKKFCVDIKYGEKGEREAQGMIYEDKLIIYCEKKLAVYGIGDDNWGQKLGEFSYESGYENFEPDYSKGFDKYLYSEEYYLNDGKVYKVIRDTQDTHYNWHYSYYVCSVKDIIEGNGKWTLAFENYKE